MISDVLFEALRQMIPYMETGIYEEPEATMIREVYDQMYKLMMHLDTPPEQTVNVKTNVKTG